MQSNINTTNIPLRAGAIFIPSGMDNVLNYDSAYYTIDSDQNCAVQFYCTNDKKNYNIIDYAYTPSTVVVNNILLQQRYIYVTIRNSSSTDQTYLNFTMLYKTSGVIEGTVDVANFPTYQKVELFDSAGASVNSTGSSLNVFVTNTVQESNQAVNLCSGTGTTISSTANFLDVNVANTGSIAVTSDVIQIGGDAIYLGSNTSTNSIPVVIASDQSAIYTNANLYDSAGNGITSSMGSLTVHDDSNAHDIDQNLKTADQNMSYTTGSLNVNITNTNNSNVNLYDSAGNGITSAMGSLTVHDDSNAHDISMNLKTADQNMSYTTGSLNVNITNTNNSPVNLYDSAGNGITSAMGSLTVYDNSNAHDIDQNLKVADQNNTYTTGSLNVNVAGGNVGVVSFPTTHTGGVLWNAATVANTNTSPSVNMTGCFKNVYTVMATCSDAAVLTVQYSPDNSTWFNTSNILNVPFASSLALDFYSSAGYIRLIASGIAATSTISGWINHN